MKLIVGLGNVGRQYHATRHNLGFDVVEMLGITFGHQPSEFKKHSKATAEVLDLKQSHDCILVKPTTMMNLSGQAVGDLVRFYKINPADVWLIYDDVDLQFGQMRIRVGGGSAGHNGVKSVIEHIGDGFWRVRLGVANQFLPTTPTDAFVLSPFMADEAAKIPTILRQTSDYLEDALLDGQIVDHTQNLIA
ncbi:aminoacyl-tRNA hydrolase [Patescibacteria group bacterium]|nr:MAG: aminoacyl-tRNA hydrolase [Patescibacteria group bacterium]